MASRTFAVIGGGVAGLQAAAQLKAAGGTAPLGRQRQLRRVIRRPRQPFSAQPIANPMLWLPLKMALQATL
jgi:glycine/D-amino acid oxidase-like deaminating enzyme